jgi:hypothetical protein
MAVVVEVVNPVEEEALALLRVGAAAMAAMAVTAPMAA